MKAVRLLAIALALLAAGCSIPLGRPVPGKQAFIQQQAPVAPAAPVEREVRYYIDERGTVWDDRGKNHGPASVPSK
jgi:hypothetical protein